MPQLEHPPVPEAPSVDHDPVVVVNRPVAAHLPERRCAAPDCTVRLSRYNPNNTCASHGGWVEASPARRGQH